MTLTQPAARRDELASWLISVMPNVDLNSLHYLLGDASSRQYLRVQAATSSYIIMDAPPDQDLVNFIQVAAILSKHNVIVPQIIHANLPQGLVIMTDLGAETYLAALTQSNQQQIQQLYMTALTTLIEIQRIDISESTLHYRLPPMNADYIDNRLEVFKHWYLQKHLGLEDTHVIDKMIASLQEIFHIAFTELTQVFVHLDYHSRNIMLCANGHPGILDFQDARCGAATYDLVSLLQDAYIVLPRTQVESLVDTYKQMAIAANIIQPLSTEALLCNFDLVGLHRHIKNLGVFARLHHRDHKSHYLREIPTLLRYINETCSRYPEVAGVYEFLNEHIIAEGD